MNSEDKFFEHGSYKAALFDPRWKRKRQEVLARDEHKCIICVGTENLHVHHRQYHFLNDLGKFKEPWEYGSKYLISLCQSCHSRAHYKYKILTKTIKGNEMGLFNLFRKKVSIVPISEQDKEQEEDNKAVPLPEILKDTVMDDSEPVEQKQADNYLIDDIYFFLRLDYEQRAYEDAISNPDLAYAEANMKQIRDKAALMIKQAKRKYLNQINSIDQRISICEQAGLVDTVMKLKFDRTMLSEHLGEINQIELDVQENTGHINYSMASYNRGFKKGLIFIALDYK